jgi:hypothetical protein
MTELPSGPGDSRFKYNRDAEALSHDPRGRGWWVSFERANEVWLYDRNFSKALRRIRFGSDRWPVNGGIEGLVTNRDSSLMLFIEGGDKVYLNKGSRLLGLPVLNKRGAFSEATRLFDGRLVALERSFRWSGLRNALVFIANSPRGYRVQSRIPLPLGSFDNMEGLAPERLADGSTRLWMIADNNFKRPQRTLLLAIDVPQGTGG